MPRYKAIIAYDGTNYCGFQRQDNGRTVQEAIETTLKRFTNGQLIEIHGSGRTDSGVHALKQVIHFDYPTVMDDEKFRYALDTQTPDDIACLSVEQVDASFHSRYLVKEKTYIYRLDVGKPRNPFKRHYASFYPYALDIEAMQHAVRDVIGTHDFTSLCASGSSVEDKVRTIYEAEINYDTHEQEIVFRFRGDGFLYKMIRILVGTLIKIGNGRMASDSLLPIIEKRDRDLAGPTAHPEGLYLAEVVYEEKDTH